MAPAFFRALYAPLLIDCLETARGDTNTHELLQLRHPNTLTSQVRPRNAAAPIFVMCRPTPPFLLGQTAPVNHAASHGSGSCDITKTFMSAKKARNVRL
jgi:hypothetical protein